MNQATQTGTAKAQSQSQSLYIRELQSQVDRLEQARQRNLSIPIDASVPYFVPMALGAAYFRSGQFENAEREYKTAIEANPNSGETHTNLAVLYMTTVASTRPTTKSRSPSRPASRSTRTERRAQEEAIGQLDSTVRFLPPKNPNLSVQESRSTLSS